MPFDTIPPTKTTTQHERNRSRRNINKYQRWYQRNRSRRNINIKE